MVICGAGIAGCAAAWQLAAVRRLPGVVLIDEHAPLSLTSDKSTECYRNWWPGPDPAMVELCNRSIDLMEQLARDSDNRFALNRRGYLYVTADPAGIQNLEGFANEASSLGAGEIRWHETPDSPYQPADPEGAIRFAPTLFLYDNYQGGVGLSAPERM